MNKRVVCGLAAAVAVTGLSGIAGAQPGAASTGGHPVKVSGQLGDGAQGGHNSAFTYAVYGDAPYGTSPTDTTETDATPAFIDAVNADPAVTAVIHVGDI